MQLAPVSDASNSEYDKDYDGSMTDAPTLSEVETSAEDDADTIVGAPILAADAVHNERDTSTIRDMATSVGDEYYEDHWHTESIPPTITNDPKNAGGTVVPPTYNTLPLSDAVCTAVFGKEFDTNWVDRFYIDPSDLAKITSPKKLEELMAPNVVMVGDFLLLVRSEKEPSHHDVRWKKAEVSKTIMGTINASPLTPTGFKIIAFDKHAKNKKYPDLKITRQDDDRHWNLSECHGPTTIIKAMNGIDLQPCTKAYNAWKELVLVRDDRRLGTLHEVRNSFHLWQEQRRLWDARRKGITPAPRNKKQWDKRG